MYKHKRFPLPVNFIIHAQSVDNGISGFEIIVHGRHFFILLLNQILSNFKIQFLLHYSEYHVKKNYSLMNPCESVITPFFGANAMTDKEQAIRIILFFHFSQPLII